ncbi:uncharacterized protein LOC124897698 [Capsicum annuum]|uniref:uncharacterized protein LOC124897698 n=1 Tax=Capsicum annuum TaxID=4072 RepID=UPI001FB06186|nr:uncharacterized protein LOC124897698 [Capsicum annuum]
MNIPLVEPLKQMADDTKFIKELVTKMRMVIFEPVNNVHHHSTITCQSLFEKKKDLGAFTIPCTVGSSNFTKVLCDLGASIKLMLLEVYIQLGLGSLKQTFIKLLMEDHTMKKLMGNFCDVLVKAASFIFPTDFVILDCEIDFEVPIILGMSFLMTGHALVDIKSRQIKF